MRGADYFDIKKNPPEESGFYEWKSPFGKIPVEYDKPLNTWFLKSNGEKLPDHVVRFYR